MQSQKKNLNLGCEDLLPQVEKRWQSALEFFKKKQHVVFISDRYHFWDEPGFVQQSLANTLVEHGIRVTWFDGLASKTHQPHIPRSHSLLEVRNLKMLRGRRLPLMDFLNAKVQFNQIQKSIKGSEPLIWVQGSLDNRICNQLPSIDVFSVFDDPYLHQPGDELTQKVKLILNQNAFGDDLFRSQYPQKCQLALPPVELNENIFFSQSPRKILPDHFPTKIMGYLGACFSEGFDFDLLEKFIKALPDWGFLIVGRTDDSGRAHLKKFERYPNFVYRSWIPREKLASIWQLLDVNLMLYKACPSNSGAYPVKFLDSLYFGVPSVATRVPKTSSLEGIIPLSSSFEELMYYAKGEAHLRKDQSRVFQSLFYEMHPKVHLAKVAEALG